MKMKVVRRAEESVTPEQWKAGMRPGDVQRDFSTEEWDDAAHWLLHPDDPKTIEQVGHVLTQADKEWVRYHLGIAGALFGQLRVPLPWLGERPVKRSTA